MAKKPQPTKTKKQQPAEKSYFFDKGYKDLWNTIKGAWVLNFQAIAKYARNLGSLRGEKLVKRVFLFIWNTLAMLSVLFFGTLFTAVLSAVHVFILLLFMLLVYIGFTFIWIVDRAYLIRKKIFTACHECKEKSLIPTYLCPSCGNPHTNLTPGVYGILKRKCKCGEKLPTTFFNGRKNLDAICPHCESPLSDRESRPICIPIVGGRSVGKTAFITAFSKDFIEGIAPDKGFETQFYNSKKQDIYNEIIRDYATGSTRMTDRPQDVNAASSVSFSFFVKHPQLKPERLVHVYDIAGEVFTDNNENEVQKQYEYCQGIVLMIDPFAIPSVRYKYEDMLAPEDVAGIGTADINEIIDSFLNKLREVTGLSDKKMATVPLAVVISKIDSAKLEEELGTEAVKALMSTNTTKFADFYDTQDYLCRKFLKENNMESFLNNVSIQFKTNRFFACSAIGHTRDKGQFKPEGVMAPMEWIMTNADPELGQLWNDHTFSKKTIGLDEN